MSISHAILGILSYEPLTGYDLKKIIEESPFMHWSGNNNQIYKALVELHSKGFVTNEVHHQEGSPSKKIYTITQEGLQELKEWVLSSPEPPECKKTFLVQLAWADLLNAEDLSRLLSQYEFEVQTQILMHREKMRRGVFSPGRTPREALIWDMMYQNNLSSLEQEQEWLKKLRAELNNDGSTNSMQYTLKEAGTKKYIEYASVEAPIRTEQHALDLLSAGYEHDTRLLLIHAEALADDFFRLRTGLAGALLQKFANYQANVAVVLTDEQRIQGKFKEFLAESNRGTTFRVFRTVEDAENWFLTL